MLTEQRFARALHEAFDDVTASLQPTTDLGAAVRDRLRSRRRRIVAARVASVPLVAAVAVGAVALWPRSDTPRPAPAAQSQPGGHPANGIRLAGYTLTFPADYKLGGQDTNCTSNLHLSADETTRLVTTPDVACPILIKSVLTALPAGAVRDVARDGSSVNPDGTAVGQQDPALAETYYIPTADDGLLYVKATVPGGPPVYVAIRFAGISPTNDAQLAELEQGLHVASTS